MIFMAGPRQTGKTTLAQQIAAAFSNHRYVNWDAVQDKTLLIRNPDFFTQGPWNDSTPPLIVFDEIHKYRNWKNYLKGMYDTFAGRYKFLVLGSGRLDVYQKGGDSLAGRYFMFNLWPLTIGELGNRQLLFQTFKADPLTTPEPDPNLNAAWEQLSQLSGFPEPFSSGDLPTYVRWWATYRRQMLREDIRDMTAVKNIDHMEILLSLLPSRVGSPLSMDSLGRDLQVSAATVKNWIQIFESFFLVFRLRPWVQKISRAISKERKLYFYNCAAIESEAFRFENMVALELLRAASSWNSMGYGEFSLHYIRNKEKEENDFLLADRNKPVLLIEAKLSESEPAKSLIKFQNVLQVPAVQLVRTPHIKNHFFNGNQNILVVSAPHWLAGLP